MMLVAISYNVSVPVVLHPLAEFDSIHRVLVMVTRVADRLCAEPGSRAYGVPSVKARWFGDVRRGRRVSDGVLARPQRRLRPGVLDANGLAGARDEVFFIDAAFAQRRKQLTSALSGWRPGRGVVQEVLDAAGVDPRARGEELSLEDFCVIARAARSAG